MMEKISSTGCLALALYVIVAFTRGAHSCSPPIGPTPPDTAESRIRYADVVVYGTVIQHYSDSRAPFDAFTAEMEILCIFKGGQVEQFINVTNAGISGGLCFSTRLDIGKSYVVFLSQSGDIFRPSESDIEVSGIADPYLNNVTRVCGLSTQYPIGVNELSTRFRCPQTDQSPNCVRHTIPTTDPNVNTEIVPPADTTETDLKKIPGPDVKVDSQENVEPGSNNGCQRLNPNSLLRVTSIIAILSLIR